MLTPEREITVREALADKIATAVSDFAVSPAPLLFTGQESFWGWYDATKNTRQLIELTEIKLITLSLLDFTDDSLEGCEGNPAVDLIYEINIFSQYDLTRVDESDDFDKKLLQSHNAFVAAVLNLRNEFLGARNLAGLTDFTVRQTNSLTMPEFIQGTEESRYVPGVFGHQVDLHEKVRLLPVEE